MEEPDIPTNYLLYTNVLGKTSEEGETPVVEIINGGVYEK